MNDLELAVRTVEDIIPDMPTKGLLKWRSILNTALVKIEAELEAAHEHTCSACLFKEYGYRDELPVAWREKGDVKICFKHEDAEVAEMLKAGIEAESPEPIDVEDALDELMAEL